MNQNQSSPPIRRKQSIRLAGHDYREPGAYFVTICTEHHRSTFGDVRDASMQLNEIGEMVSEAWTYLPRTSASICTDATMIMPDHLHRVLVLGSNPECLDSPALGDIVRYFKGQTTNSYIRQVKHGVWPPLSGRFWQRQYHDRIIRSDHELEQISVYIETNPERWWQQRNHP